MDGRSKSSLRITLACIAGSIFIALNVSTFGANGSSSGIWPVFHYYLNAKYFGELGYRSLYACSLEAAGERWQTIGYVRDLETYDVVPRSQLRACPREEFSDARWQSFTRDVATLASKAPTAYFGEALTDKGFNPPPSWAVPAGSLASLVPLDPPGLATLLFNLDILAILATVAIVWRERGYRLAALTGALLLAFFGTFGIIGGNFLQYLWVPLVALAAYLWRRGRPAASGLAIGAAAGLQIFPIVFALPIIAMGLPRWGDRAPSSGARPVVRFGTALVAVLLASVAIGSLSPTGPAAWASWREKIADHESYIRGEIFNIGLVNLVATAGSASYEPAEIYREDVPNTAQRLRGLEGSRATYYAALVLLLALVGVGMWRSSEPASLWYSYPLMYGLLAMSPFYYLSLALLPYLAATAPPAVRRYATWGTAALLLLHLPYILWGYISFSYLPHLFSELTIAAFMYGLAGVGVCATYRRRGGAGPSRTESR